MLRTRRAVLTAATGIAAGVGLPLSWSRADAASATDIIPQTMAQLTGALGVGATVTQTSFPLSHLVIGYSGATQPGVRVRTATGWGDWQPVPDCHRGLDDATPDKHYGLLTVPGAIG